MSTGFQHGKYLDMNGQRKETCRWSKNTIKKILTFYIDVLL